MFEIYSCSGFSNIGVDAPVREAGLEVTGVRAFGLSLKLEGGNLLIEGRAEREETPEP